MRRALKKMEEEGRMVFEWKFEKEEVGEEERVEAEGWMLG